MPAPDDPTRTSGSTDANRLERAIAAYLDFTQLADPPEREAFLDAHADIRELLEPMFDEPGDNQPDAAEDAGDRRLGEFRLRRRIGSGGMGVVYEAVQETLGRRVALKVLRPQLALSPRALLRFQREASTIASLEHPGIVDVLSTGEDDGVHYFVMDFVDGAPLNRVIARVKGADPSTLSGSSVGETVVQETERSADPETLPTSDAARFARVWSKGYVETVVNFAIQVAEALQHAHDNGVIHRDVKPSNVLVRRDGTVVLTDFGLARVEDQPGMTMTGEFAGSPHYIAPEQAMAKRMPVDHRADIFSLGATLYELLTLRLAFPGETNQEVLARIISKEPTDPQKLNPRLSPDLAAITLKALEKDPDRRYASAQELGDELRAFLEYRPVKARRASLGTRLMRTCRREPLKAALIGVLLVGVPALLTMGGYVYAKDSSIEVGERVQLQDEIERQLARAYQQLHEGIPARAVQQFSRILDDHPEVLEARVGRVLAYLDSGRRGRELAQREVAGDDPELRGVRQLVAERIRTDRDLPPGTPTELPEPHTSLDFFVAGMIALTRGEGGATRYFASAYELLSQALLRSKRVRRHFLSELAHVAGHLQDPVLIRRHAAALEARWPDEEWTRMVVGLATARLDPARSAALGKAALAEDPGNHLAALIYGRALSRQGLLAEAERCFRSALARRDSPQAREALAHCLARQKRFDAALDELTYVFKRRPQRISTVLSIADMHIQKQDFAVAHDWAMRAYGLAPDDPFVLRVLAITQQRRGNGARAEELARQAYAARPDNADVLTTLAMICNSTGRYRESIDLCERALEDRPDHEEAWLRMGHAHGFLKDFGAALRCYDKCLEQAPGDAVAHLGRGTALFFRDELAAAIAALRRAIDLDPQLPGAHSVLGQALVKQGDRAGAARAFVNSLEVDPKDWRSRTQLGVLRLQDGDAAAARDLFRTAAEHDPDNPEIQFNLAISLETLGDSDGAKTALERVIDLQPDAANPRYRLGALLFRQGDRDAALERFQEAVARDPNHALAQVNAGQILLGTGRYAEALPYLEQAHALAGSTPEWRYPTAKWIELARTRAGKR